MARQYILIGASAASFGALASLTRLDPEAQCILISTEEQKPYNKCLLSDYLGGLISQEALAIYSNHGTAVQLVLGQSITFIDPQNKQVSAASGQSWRYDALFLGMGSSPWMPALEGIGGAGIFTFHTHADTDKILEYIKKNPVKKVAIIGAGLSGLEAADALLKHNLSITIIERGKQVLPHMLSCAGALFLQEKIKQSGVQLLLNTSCDRFELIDNAIHRIIIPGSKIDADMVIVATGLKPNKELCAAAGITCDEYGIVVDAHLKTNQAHIYAGGDLISVTDRLTGKKMRSCLWPDAMQQGMHAGMAMAGFAKPYVGPTIITSTAFFGIKYARAGLLDEARNTINKAGDDFLHTFSIMDQKLVGFEVLGMRHNLGSLRRLILTGQSLTSDQLEV